MQIDSNPIIKPKIKVDKPWQTLSEDDGRDEQAREG